MISQGSYTGVVLCIVQCYHKLSTTKHTTRMSYFESTHVLKDFSRWEGGGEGSQIRKITYKLMTAGL